MEYKSGFFSIIGRPNVGKSTLVNLLTGEKVAIMSPKPQTTRNIIKTVITDSEAQIVFIDTPGIHKPKNKLGDYMLNLALDSLNEVDGVLFLVEATDKEIGPGDRIIIENLNKIKVPVFLIINKIDLIDKESILPLIEKYSGMMSFKQIIPVSALQSETAEIVISEIKKVLKPGPKYFPDDMLTDQPEKVIVQELIREKILLSVKDEVPHGVGVDVILFKEKPEKQLIEIQANIFCERDSHKGILIGKNGAMLKKIGSLARVDIERFLGTKVYLQLWVKVKNDWRNSSLMLNSLGYK